MKVNLDEEKFARLVICMAIGKEHYKIDEMSENNASMTKDIKLTVDGVELNFMNVIKSINAKYENAVKDEAQNFIDAKFYELDNMLNNLREQVEEQINITEADLYGRHE